MKKLKQIALATLCASLGTGGLKAQVSSSTNCQTATGIVLTNTAQTITQSNESGWMYFVSTERNPDIQLRSDNGSIALAQTYKGRCDSLNIVANDTISTDSDTLLVLVLHNVGIGDTIRLFTQRNLLNTDTAAFQLNLIETQSLFTYLDGVTPANLTTEQSKLYQKLLNHNMYSSINFVSMGNIVEKTPYGKLFIDLPFLYCNNTKFEMTRVEYNDENNFTWIGDSYVYDDTLCTLSSITLLKVNSYVMGQMSLDGRSYGIFDLTDGVIAICEEDKNLVRGGCGNDDTGGEPPAEKEAGDPCDANRTKVLVLYTPNADLAATNVTATAHTAIAQINKNWSYSKINNQLELAAVEPINFTEGLLGPLNDEAENDLDDISINNATVTNLRNYYKAEIVVLFTHYPYTISGSDVWGLAKAHNAAFSEAFVLCDITTATAGNYYTFTHEINHLFGARHENNCVDNSCAHSFKTGVNHFLWMSWGGVNRKTVMNNLNVTGSFVEFTSNPNVTCYDNVPTGTASRNNAKQVNAMKSTIEDFYSDTQSFDITVNRIGGNMWYAQAVICNPSEYTYKWLASQNGYNWIQVATGANPAFAMPYASGLIKCEVRNSSNVLVYSKQKTYISILSYIGIVFRTSEATGIHEKSISKNSLTCIPNPNNGSFDIELSSAEPEHEITMVLTDVAGKIVKEIYKGSASGGKQQFQVDNSSKLAAGVYFLKVSGKTLNLVNKVIIQ